MVVFRKKRRMIDIREMQKKGLIRMPAAPPENIQTDSEGFVDFSQNTNQETTPSQETQQSTASFFGFMDSPPTIPQNSSTQSNSEDFRKISSQLSDIDNKLYKLEQRIEVLERKSNIGY
jgi:hypothetical protein